MSLALYEVVNYTEKQEMDEHIEKVVDIYQNVDALRGCDSDEVMEDNKRRVKPTQHIGADKALIRFYKLISVCLLFLCVLLLTAFTVLWVKFTAERSQLQISYNNLATEGEQLQSRYNKLQRASDQLQQRLSALEESLKKEGRYFNFSIYSLSTSSSWTKSRSECLKRGADLVIVNSQEEQKFISKHFDHEVWIGLSDTETEGIFKWVDGKNLTTKFWWDAEPNDFKNNEDCVITGYRLAKSNITTWADYDCGYSVVGLCERHFY